MTRDKTITWYTKMEFWLVLGTWGLVIISIINTWLVQSKMSSQEQAMREATEIETRPYLQANQTNHRFDRYCAIDNVGPSRSNSLVAPLSMLDSPVYQAATVIGCMTKRRVQFTNLGRTPLRIKALAVGTLSKYVWQDSLRKSPESLVKRIRAGKLLASLETDVVIRPSVSFDAFQDAVGEPAIIPKDRWERILAEDTTLLVYPYIFVEYEDFKNNNYNVLLIEYASVPFKLSEGPIIVKDSATGEIFETKLIQFQNDLMEQGIEKYRQDVI